MEIFLQIRRHKTTIFLDTKENATLMDVKKMISGIIKRAPEDQKIFYEGIELEDRDELAKFLQHCGRAQCPAHLGLALRDEKTKKFEDLYIEPYKTPPRLPTALERDDESF